MALVAARLLVTPPQPDAVAPARARRFRGQEAVPPKKKKSHKIKFVQRLPASIPYVLPGLEEGKSVPKQPLLAEPRGHSGASDSRRAERKKAPAPPAVAPLPDFVNTLGQCETDPAAARAHLAHYFCGKRADSDWKRLPSRYAHSIGDRSLSLVFGFCSGRDLSLCAAVSWSWHRSRTQAQYRLAQSDRVRHVALAALQRRMRELEPLFERDLVGTLPSHEALLQAWNRESRLRLLSAHDSERWQRRAEAHMRALSESVRHLAGDPVAQFEALSPLFGCYEGTAQHEWQDHVGGPMTRACLALLPRHPDTLRPSPPASAAAADAGDAKQQQQAPSEKKQDPPADAPSEEQLRQQEAEDRALVLPPGFAEFRMVEWTTDHRDVCSSVGAWTVTAQGALVLAVWRHGNNGMFHRFLPERNFEPVGLIRMAPVWSDTTTPDQLKLKAAQLRTSCHDAQSRARCAHDWLALYPDVEFELPRIDYSSAEPTLRLNMPLRLAHECLWLSDAQMAKRWAPLQQPPAQRVAQSQSQPSAARGDGNGSAASQSPSVPSMWHQQPKPLAAQLSQAKQTAAKSSARPRSVGTGSASSTAASAAKERKADAAAPSPWPVFKHLFLHEASFRHSLYNANVHRDAYLEGWMQDIQRADEIADAIAIDDYEVRKLEQRKSRHGSGWRN